MRSIEEYVQGDQKWSDCINSAKKRDATRNEQQAGIFRRQGPVYDEAMRHRMEAQGFFFDVEQDNRTAGSEDDWIRRSLRFFEPRNWHPDPEAFRLAKMVTYSAFGRDRKKFPNAYLPPLEWETDVLAEHITPSSNSGAPQHTHRGAALMDDYKLASDILLGKKSPPPCVPFSRGGFSEEGPQLRFIWGFPLSMNMIEAIFARPLYSWFALHDIPSPFARTKEWLRAKTVELERFNTRIGVDASRFDSSLHPRLINLGFDVLGTWFDPDGQIAVQTDNRNWVQVSHKRVWKHIRRYFVRTPFIAGKLVIEKERGTPSGSEFTTPLNTVVMFFIIQYAMFRCAGKLVPKKDLLVLGDDVLLGTNSTVGKGALASAMDELGITLNTEKTEFSRRGEPVSFLGHHWLKGSMVRPLVELAQRTVFPERSETLRRVNWKTRFIAISLSADNGVELLQKAFGLRSYTELSMMPMPGPRPVHGLEAGEVGWRERATEARTGDLPLRISRG